jgi:hypothetical protein
MQAATFLATSDMSGVAHDQVDVLSHCDHAKAIFQAMAGPRPRAIRAKSAGFDDGHWP